MKAYKGFNKDMTCRNFKYEEGKSYENDKAELCKSGFHACENPIDCFGHYRPGSSVYHEVDLDDVSEEREPDDTKVVAKKIKVGSRLGIPQICQLTFEYVKAHCTNENNAVDGQQVNAGYSGAATAGYRGAATAGEYGAATAGNRGAATAGDRGAATSKGSSACGKNGLSVARGNGVKVKGGLGAILVIAEENDNNYSIKDWKAVIVDGFNIKEDTWYVIKNGDLKEVNQ